VEFWVENLKNKMARNIRGLVDKEKRHGALKQFVSRGTILESSTRIVVRKPIANTNTIEYYTHIRKQKYT